VVEALNNMIVPILAADPIVNGARWVAFVRQTMKARGSESRPYSKALAIRSLILETFAMEG
jgi:hypothetical protein